MLLSLFLKRTYTDKMMTYLSMFVNDIAIDIDHRNGPHRGTLDACGAGTRAVGGGRFGPPVGQSARRTGERGVVMAAWWGNPERVTGGPASSLVSPELGRSHCQAGRIALSCGAATKGEHSMSRYVRSAPVLALVLGLLANIPLK